MSFARFLAAGAILSLVLHGTGAAFFAKDPNEISIAASEGGGVSVIGSIEDLVAYRMEHDSLILKREDTFLNTRFGEYRLRAYQQTTNDQVHLALRHYPEAPVF